MSTDDAALGMGERITRRDFVGGMAAAATALATPTVQASAPGPGTQKTVPNYPPLRSGLRGQYPGSFEIAHQVRDGAFGAALSAEETGEHHDLVVVGAGISGLAAAHFFRKVLGQERKILLLDNHDDFGGHAKRNEFRHAGRTYLSFGGTMSIETPFPYSYTAKALLAELGVDPGAFSRYERPARVQGLGTGVFFDAGNFGVDRLVAGFGERPWQAFFADAPLTPRMREDLLRVHATREERLPGLDPAAKAQALKQMSYATWLTQHVGIATESLAFFRGQGFRNNMRVDTCPAFVAWRLGGAGFDGMDIAAEPLNPSEIFHFPDGNATLARLLVNRLVPASFGTRHNPESIILAPLDYAALDRADAPVRIRLEATAVRVEHIGKPDRATERAVRVVYAKDGRLRQVTAANVILACFNNIVPFLVPGLPVSQSEALRYGSKVPMMYSSALVRNWKAWRTLGVREVLAPNGFHSRVQLDTPLSMGGYESLVSEDQPAVIQMFRNWNKPGLPRREQNRVGRADMLATDFATLERETRQQLNRMLGPGGFDARRDLLALTINRWPHGYAYTYDTLGDPDMPEAERPHVLGRRPFGRIAIANADAGAAAYTNVSIDQAERAVQDCLSSRGMI